MLRGLQPVGENCDTGGCVLGNPERCPRLEITHRVSRREQVNSHYCEARPQNSSQAALNVVLEHYHRLAIAALTGFPNARQSPMNGGAGNYG